MRVDIELIPYHHWVAVLPDGSRITNEDLEMLKASIVSMGYSIGDIRR